MESLRKKTLFMVTVISLLFLAGPALGEVVCSGGGLRLVQEGGTFDTNNLASGKTAFAKDLIGNGAYIPTHDIPNLNNGTYGNSSSWIGNSANSFCGISLGASTVNVCSIAFGRDNTGGMGDRTFGPFTLQYTTVANPTNATPDSSWTTIGTLNYKSESSGVNPYAYPYLRHRYNFNTVAATGIRLICKTFAAYACIDEIELYNYTINSGISKAYNPSPANVGKTGPGESLIWTAGDSAGTHDVYLGTTFNAVNNATTASPEFKGNQAGVTYNPGTLALGTYYWRIDEVNGGTTTKGDVWSFDVVKWAQSEFVVGLGWVLAGYATDINAFMQSLANLGLTTIMDSAYLDLAQTYGMNVDLYYAPTGPEIAEMFKSHPATWGYHQYDEPHIANPPVTDAQVAAQHLAVHQADPTRPSLTNIQSINYGITRTTAQNFINTVHPEILSFDFYQWYWPTYTLAENLEWYRKRALENNIPLYSWVEVDAKSDATTNARRRRYSTYMSLVYGVKGIWWFTKDRIYNQDGTILNQTYYNDVQAINVQINNLGPYLVGLTSTAVYHANIGGGVKDWTGTDPMVAIPGGNWVQISNSIPIALGMFSGMPDYECIMISNRDITNVRSVDVTFKRSVSSVEAFDAINNSWSSLTINGTYPNQYVTQSLDQGCGKLLRIVAVPDTTPPTPNPATFASAPAAISSSAISMTATTGTDDTGPVQYYFDETSGNPGGTDSGWQTSASYTDSGLNASTQYTYTVQMRDSAPTPNVGTASAPASATTNSPSAPTYVAAGAVSSGTGAITPALPSGIATGDILLLFLETSNQAISISNQNGGTWTAVTNSPQYCGTAAGTTGARLTVFWSRYNGTQGAPTTSDSGDHQLGRMVAIRGAASSGDPWNVTAGGVEAVDDTSGSIPGATTTVANTLVVTAIATSLPDASSTAKFSGWTNANLTSLTERTDNSVTAGNGGGLAIATGVKATAGAYGNTAVTLVNVAYKGMMSIALKN